MKEKNRDMINRYIDNELDSNELNEFTALIEKDENLVKDLKAMKIVELSLRKMEFDISPSDVTHKVMQKIMAPKPAKRSNWFFWLCISVMLIGIGVFTFYAIQSYQPVKDTGTTDKVVNTVKEFVGDKTKSLDTLLKSADFKLISMVLTMLVIITGYFVFETHRNFKNKLKSL